MNDLYIIGNWKLYLGAAESVRLAKRLAQTFRFWPMPHVHVAVCPSFPVLAKAYDVMIGSRLALGCQDVGLGHEGPMTGAVSAADLAEVGCAYAIVGHSERRAAGDDDEVVKQKFIAAHAAGLMPVLCVGERTSGKRAAAALRFIKKQLQAVLVGTRGKKVLVVYEPVWAISTFGKGKPCPPAYAAAIADGIRTILHGLRNDNDKHASLIYGGSVDKTNIRSYTDREHFHGALVGNASTKLDEYVTLVKHIST